MSINSIAFLIFLLISVLSYYAVPRRGRWVVLLFAGAFFYLSYSLRASVYLGVTIFLTYGAGRWLGSMNRRQKDEAEGLSRREKAEVKKRWTRRKRRVLAAALLVNFLTLAVFKYFDAWFETLNRILALISADFSFRPLNLLLPLGISFYIFQTSGYLIDIYRGREQEERNFFRYALFASYFPQMIQGPINRYGDLGRQLKQEHTFRAENIRDGIQLMIWGMLKKTFIADTLAPGVSEIYSNYGNYSGAVVFFGAVLYCLQLYCDFSGGIDIVRGASNLFGIRMAENFRRPYFAASIDEFWRRWHISLGEWMKDYLFYPLALSKWMTKLGKRVRAVFGDRVGKLTAPCGATVIVFLAVGIWQGPGLSNVAYGLWNGCLMSAAMFFAPQLRRINSALRLNTESRGDTRIPRCENLYPRGGRKVFFGSGFSDGGSGDDKADSDRFYMESQSGGISELRTCSAGLSRGGSGILRIVFRQPAAGAGDPSAGEAGGETVVCSVCTGLLIVIAVDSLRLA